MSARSCVIALSAAAAAAGCGSGASHPTRAVAPVRIYFCTAFSCGHGATRGEEQALVTRFDRDAHVERIVFISQKQALRLMRRKFPDEVKTLRPNPFPAALKIYADSPSAAAAITRELSDAKPARVERVVWRSRR